MPKTKAVPGLVKAEAEVARLRAAAGLPAPIFPRGRTAQEEKLLLDAGHCPHCGGDDLSSHPDHDGDGNSYQNFSAECDACGATWTEIYRLVRVDRFEAP